MSAAKNSEVTACVIGDPVKHSLSPLLHNTWIKALGLKAHYTHCHSTKEAFEKTVRALFTKSDFAGMNITLPHKEAALALADQVSHRARKAGAANLLYKKNGILYADNTDIEGFTAPLLSSRPIDQWRGGKTIIIGAGGAARAVLIGALNLHPEHIIILNRTDARAARLARDFGASVQAGNWKEREQGLDGANLLINASAAGMHGQGPLDLSLRGLNQNALVYDLVYTPLFTPLLKRAKECGFETLNGLDMLIAQARPSFEAFFGSLPPKDTDVKAVLIDALESKQ